MSTSWDQLEQRMHAVDRFVQGEMSAVEAEAFEQQMRADASLAADVAAQRELAASLATAFSPSPPPNIADLPKTGAGSGPGTGPILPGMPWLWGGGAALIGVAAAITWFATGSGTGAGSPPTDLATAYQHAVAPDEPFVPRTTDETEFAICSKIGHSVLFESDEGATFGRPGGGIADSTPMAISVPMHLGADRMLLVFDLAHKDEPAERVTTTRISDTLFKHVVVRHGLRVTELSPREKPAMLSRIRVGS